MDPSALGRYLRESREAKELTLEDAVTALRIRRPILEAFEQGDFSVVETQVQVRGLLRNYARFLDLEEERVLQYYEAAILPRRRSRFARRNPIEPELAAPRRITDTPPSLPAVQISDTNPRRIKVKRNNLLRNITMLLVSLAALSVIIFVLVSMLRQPLAPIEPTAFTTSLPLDETTLTATFMPTSTSLAPTMTLDFAGQGFVGLAVRMELVQRSWVRIVADDVEQYAGMLEPNSVMEVDANNAVQITAANAIALRLTVNGQEQASFGSRGQQANVNITSAGISIALEGEVSPTPSLTPVPTNTPSVTPTIPTATATAVQINTIGQSGVVSAQADSSPTPAPPTPTSIFDNPASPMPTIKAVSADTTVQNSSSTTAIETNPTTLPVATEPGVVLPLRATPANPTPTKAG
jgi:hypothetical protein